MTDKRLRIGIVAGEISGDAIAADFIRAIKARYPHAEFEGVAGEQMQDAGCHQLFPLERLSVMGFSEVLGRLKELLNIRKQLVQHFISNPPDVFVGVDAPDFNLTLERRLKEAGVPTVHYVSPSVWAWREKRVKKIARAVDLILTLFPFEVEFYARHHVRAQFVGHPMADAIEMTPNKNDARQELELPQDKKIVALLPGSRRSEVKKLGELLIQTAQACLTEDSSLHFVSPMATPAIHDMFDTMLQEQAPSLPITLTSGKSRQAIQASDVVLLASGTATLETALLKRPMVVCYRVQALSYWIMKRLATVEHISLPNNLSGKSLVPEFIQERATVENLTSAVMGFLNNPQISENAVKAFYEIHQSLKQNASERAADAVLELIDARNA